MAKMPAPRGRGRPKGSENRPKPPRQSTEISRPLLSDAWRVDPAQMMYDLGRSPDPWQARFLRENHEQFILCCSRRSGKTCAVSIKCLHHAMFSPPGEPATVILFAPAGKQTDEVLHELHIFYEQLGRPVPRDTDRTSILDFDNGSRIIPFANNEATARGVTPTLIVIDEGSRVDDALYQAVSPMLALGKAKLIVLSTPNGKRGWFYKEWSGQGGRRWHRIQITAEDCPRITREFIEDERLKFGDAYIAQEYFCSFTMPQGLVYPEFERNIVDPGPVMVSRAFGGVDFGWRNPSAFVVILLDADDVAWIVEEVYGSWTTNEELAAKVLRCCRKWGIEMVIGDSAAPQSIEIMRRGGVPIRGSKKGAGSIKAGCTIVGERLRTGRLRCFRTCIETIREFGLYSYAIDDLAPKDVPIDADNHLCDAARYAIVDAVDLGRTPKRYDSLESAAADQTQLIAEQGDERLADHLLMVRQRQERLETEGWDSYGGLEQ